MLFPRVVRLDDSDDRVYEPAAAAGEWAVPGAFVFLDIDMAQAGGKLRQAFHHGFLGTDSFGWGTLVQVEEIAFAEYAAVVERLAQHFVQRLNAPSIDAAREMAQEEAAFAASICEHPRHTLLAVDRALGEEGIEENFRVVRPPSGLDHEKIKLWKIVEDDG
ncbi:MAG TPA: DUF6505 family protein [Burkholderiales bacterium]